MTGAGASSSGSAAAHSGGVGPGVLALGPGSIGVTDPSSLSEMPPPSLIPPSAYRSARNSPDPNTDVYDGQGEGQAIEPAVQYVQKIKQRCDADTYKQFLEILSRYHQKPDTIDEVRFPQFRIYIYLFYVTTARGTHADISAVQGRPGSALRFQDLHA